MARKKIGKNAAAHYIQEEGTENDTVGHQILLVLEEVKNEPFNLHRTSNEILALQAITYPLPI